MLTLDVTGTFAVARHEVGQLHARFGVPNQAQQDVTATATWTSSNPSIVTVDAGSVKAVGLGTASITAQYQGQSITLNATARRRTAITGSVRLSNAAGVESMVVLIGQVDGHNVGYTGTSSAQAAQTVQLLLKVPDSVVDPGPHEVAVTLPEQTGAPNTYVSDASSYADVIDRDTKEKLKRIPLPVQTKTLSFTDKMTWTVQVDVFSQ